MEAYVLKAEKELKTLWVTCWWAWFVVACIAWLLLMLVQPIVFGLCLIGWVIATLPVLAWIPAFYTTLEYVIDNDSIKGRSGVFWKKHVTIPFTKVTNLDITQGPLQRAFGVGTIHVQTAGAGSQQGAKAELSLFGIKRLEEVKDDIMAKIRAYPIAAAEQPRPKAEDQGDSQVLDRILNELVEIRKVLQNKNG